MNPREPAGELFDAAPQSSLEGLVKRVVYSDETSGWTVLRLRPTRGRTTATVVGPLVDIHPGQTVSVSGEWVDDPKYGRQFRADSYLAIEPRTLEGLESYLGSGLIPGVGPVMAERLVSRFGLETLTVLDEEPQRLREVPGIGRHRAAKIQAAWKRQRDARDVMVFLRTYGISAGQAVRIYRRYGRDAIRLLKDNPYRLAVDLHGIGFQTADQIAGRLGIDPESTSRTLAGLAHVLRQAENQGHVFLPRAELLERTLKLLQQARDTVATTIEASLRTGDLVEDPIDRRTDALYRPAMHAAEAGIASRLAALDRPVEHLSSAELDKRLGGLSSLRDISLSADQREAIVQSMQRTLLVITGGPGTGKTTLIRAIVEDLRRRRRRVLLAAPTGRAAKRLAATSSTDARTLHRLLEFDPRTMAFQRSRDRPLEADCLIIDESSMIDTPLAFHVLQAVPEGCQLILVGDVDQLPPVGPGKVLDDIIRSGFVKVVRLREIFRQAESGLIVENAHRIRQGRQLHLDVDRPTDFYFIERTEPEDLLATLDHLVATRIPRRFGIDPRADLQVLAPMRRGLVGSENLNRRLQSLLNPDGAAVELGRERLRVGDRVMQVRNNYELDVFNGDIGTVIGPSADGETLRLGFDGRIVDYRPADLEEIVLAYACSVHKAQGSEFPCVILILHSQHYVMLQRNLLYTGVTRGERLVIVLGERRSVSIALANDRPTMRHTGLAERLRSND